MKIVVDCANGAAYNVTPTAIWELGAEVVAMGVTPNGININDGVGSTALAAIKARVIAEGADMRHCAGWRCRPADRDRRKGRGGGRRPDHGADRQPLARRRAAEGRRGGRHGDVQPRAGTLPAGQGLELVRTQVGDRYVLEAMRSGGYNVGGEQSGHMILLDHATTGDGTIAAMQVLAALVRTGKRGERTAQPVRTGAAIAQERASMKAAIRWRRRACRR